MDKQDDALGTNDVANAGKAASSWAQQAGCSARAGDCVCRASFSRGKGCRCTIPNPSKPRFWSPQKIIATCSSLESIPLKFNSYL